VGPQMALKSVQVCGAAPPSPSVVSVRKRAAIYHIKRRACDGVQKCASESSET
jgi:hypothetical protein